MGNDQITSRNVYFIREETPAKLVIEKHTISKIVSTKSSITKSELNQHILERNGGVSIIDCGERNAILKPKTEDDVLLVCASLISDLSRDERNRVLDRLSSSSKLRS